jgi:hypothetical protein
MRYFLTLTAHASLAAVEERRSLWRRPASPVPVWLGTIIPTLDSQSVFVCVSVIPVPGQEVAGTMDGHGVLHMNGDEIIESGFGARVLRGWEFRRCSGNALNGGDVGLFLRRADVAPDCMSEPLIETRRRVLAYHSLRTLNLALVHVADWAMAASIAGRPLVASSDTTSAEHRTESKDTEARRA